MFRKYFAGFFHTPEVGVMEALLARVFLALLVAEALWDPGVFPRQESPVGLARWFDLTWLAQPAAFQVFQIAMYALLAAYAWGIALPLVLPLAAFGHILMFTLLNSQGHTHHGHQIVSLVLLTQALVVGFHHLFSKRCMLQPDDALNGRLLWHTIAVVAGAYVVSAISKVDNSGGEWLWNSEYVALDLVKAQRQEYFSHLYPWDAGDSVIAVWLLGHPWMARLFFTGGMLVELFSFLALGGRAMALAVGVGLIAMHRGIALLMGLDFLNFEVIDAIYFVNVPFLMSWMVNRVRTRRPAMPGATLSP